MRNAWEEEGGRGVGLLSGFAFLGGDSVEYVFGFGALDGIPIV